MSNEQHTESIMDEGNRTLLEIYFRENGVGTPDGTPNQEREGYEGRIRF